MASKLQLYKELWKFIDATDHKHSQANLAWQQREVEAVMGKLVSFHLDFEPLVTARQHHDKITNLIDKFDKTQSLDYLDMDTLKDRIHKIIDSYSSKEFIEDIYDEKPLSYFNKKTFYDTYFGHGKEAYEKSLARREYFFYHFLEKSKHELGDCFFTMLHDIVQNSTGAGRWAEYVNELTEYRKFGIINEEAFDQYNKRLAQIIVDILLKGGWGVEQNEETLHNAIRFIDGIYDYKTKKRVWNNGYNLTEDEIYSSVNCSSGNCNIRVKLTEFDKESIFNGTGLESKYCEHHKIVDEMGSDYRNKTLESYTKELPKTPVILRWVGIEDEGYKKNLRKRFEEFRKNGDIKIINEVEETYVNSNMDEDKKIKKWKFKVLYLKFIDKTSLENFFNNFKDDFTTTCSSPEILDDESVIQKYRQFQE